MKQTNTHPVSNLPYIREKIYQIRSALMYSMSNELIRIPNNIVTILRLDEDGQLWFLCQRPLQPVEQCERSFPVRLVFYRKGISFFLEVSGKATIVNGDNDFMLPGIMESSSEKPILVKMDIKNFEITKPEEKRKRSRFDEVLEHSYKWLAHAVAFSRPGKSVLHKLTHINQA